MLARQVLPERAAEKDVEDLNTAADPPDRRAVAPRRGEEVPFDLVTFREQLDAGVRQQLLAPPVGRHHAERFGGKAGSLERLDVRLGVLLRAGREDHQIPHADSRCTRAATPMPPETQRVAMPSSRSRAAMPWSRVTRMRVPVAPIGWPRAIAPPSGFTVSAVSGMPSPFRQARTWLANASFSSISSMSERA